MPSLHLAGRYFIHIFVRKRLVRNFQNIGIRFSFTRCIQKRYFGDFGDFLGGVPNFLALLNLEQNLSRIGSYKLKRNCVLLGQNASTTRNDSPWARLPRQTLWVLSSPPLACNSPHSLQVTYYFSSFDSIVFALGLVDTFLSIPLWKNQMMMQRMSRKCLLEVSVHCYVNIKDKYLIHTTARNSQNSHTQAHNSR